jgi:hypothetical protein
MVMEKEFDRIFWKELFRLPGAEQDEVRRYVKLLRKRFPVHLYPYQESTRSPGDLVWLNNEAEKNVLDVLEFGWDKDDVILWNYFQCNDKRHRLTNATIAAAYEVSEAAISKRLRFHKRLLNKILHETKLTRHQRSVADKYWIQDLSYEDIARDGKSKGNHQETIERVKERLGERLKTEHDFLAWRFLARECEAEETTGLPAFDWQWRCRYYDQQYLWTLKLRELPDRTEIKFIRGIQPVIKPSKAAMEAVDLEYQRCAVAEIVGGMPWWRSEGWRPPKWDRQREIEERAERILEVKLMLQWRVKRLMNLFYREAELIDSSDMVFEYKYGKPKVRKLNTRDRHARVHPFDTINVLYSKDPWRSRLAREVWFFPRNYLGRDMRETEGVWTKGVETLFYRELERENPHPWGKERWNDEAKGKHNYCPVCSSYPSKAHKERGYGAKYLLWVKKGEATVRKRPQGVDGICIHCHCSGRTAKSERPAQKFKVTRRFPEQPEGHIVTDPWYEIKSEDKERLVKSNPFGHEQAVLLRYKGYRKLIEWKPHWLLPYWVRSEYEEWDIPHGERWVPGNPFTGNTDMDQVESLHESDPLAEGVEIPSEEWPEHILSCHERSCLGCSREGAECQFDYESEVRDEPLSWIETWPWWKPRSNQPDSRRLDIDEVQRFRKWAEQGINPYIEEAKRIKDMPRPHPALGTLAY